MVSETLENMKQRFGELIEGTSEYVRGRGLESSYQSELEELNGIRTVLRLMSGQEWVRYAGPLSYNIKGIISRVEAKLKDDGHYEDNIGKTFYGIGLLLDVVPKDVQSAEEQSYSFGMKPGTRSAPDQELQSLQTPRRGRQRSNQNEGSK